jgi:hypothetical protein
MPISKEDFEYLQKLVTTIEESLYEAKDIIKSANKHLYEQWHAYGELTTSEFLSMGPSIQKVVEELEKEIEPEDEED